MSHASARRSILAAALIVLLSTANARAQSCATNWIPTFGSQIGLTGSDIRAFSVFDDGSGPALFAGGSFSAAGSTPVGSIARWNGTSWSALSGGLDSTGIPEAMVVFDDGTGPQLYVAGAFTMAGGVPAQNIARWDGTSWTSVGTGSSSVIRALAVFDDGSGPALYAGGDFVTIGGTMVNRIAKWDGSTWSALGNALGLNDSVHALAVFDDGGGPALYAGGSFTSAGGAPANHVAKWNASTWSTLSTGTDHWVYTLQVHDAGGGNALFAGGTFSMAGGVNAPRIARWSASGWSGIGGGMVGIAVYTLGVFDDGDGAALYAGGSFMQAGSVSARHIARWRGSSWSALAIGVGATGGAQVHALAVFGGGAAGPSALYVGGHIESAGGLGANLIARWRSSGWSVLGSGLSGGVYALTVFDDRTGAGPALYAGGTFLSAGDQIVNRIAKWNGSSWSSLGSGIGGHSQAIVTSLVSFDDGGGAGPLLYAGGWFDTAGGVSAWGIARWNGSSWSALGVGLGGFANALTVFDDGSGPALYVGGNFTTIGGTTVNHVAKWNGTSWVGLAGGVGGFPLPNPGVVRALAVFDDGSGPALYAGGRFLVAGGVPAYHLAKWNGSAWSPLAGGTDDQVYGLGVFDDGFGPALYACGTFTSPATGIAKWNGMTWSALGQGISGEPVALRALDLGNGPALYVAGTFTSPPRNVAKWNGASWSGMQGGTNDPCAALAAFDDGSPGGTALFVGGNFTSASTTGDSYLAKWDCVPNGTLVPYCFGDGSSLSCPCSNSGAPGHGCANSLHSVGAHLAATGNPSVANDTVVLSANGMSGTMALFFQGASTRPPFVADDGIGCVGGPFLRLGIQVLAAGAAQFPNLGQQPVSVRGALPPLGGWRYYQGFYRNAAPGFCTPAVTNRTNGVAIHWGP